MGVCNLFNYFYIYFFNSCRKKSINNNFFICPECKKLIVDTGHCECWY